MGIFIDATSLPATADGFIQLLFLLAVYGYILAQASNMISDGSELLLLVPSLAGVVGSVVLPILGAVPDGAIVLFSGMGENAQSELTVGVGALAGSTIMLLTIPWALSVIGGRVDLDPSTGEPVYKKPRGSSKAWAKLADPTKLTLDTGVHVSHPVQTSAKIMLATAATYLVIQIPAFIYYKETEAVLAMEEKPWALVGLILAMIAFSGYLWYQWKISSTDEIKDAKIEEIAVNRISKGRVSLLGVLGPEFVKALHDGEAGGYGSIPAGEGEERLPEHLRHRLSAVIRPFFLKYDADNSGHIDAPELAMLIKDMGESMTAEELRNVFEKYDKDHSGQLDFEEFKAFIIEYTVRVIKEDQPRRGSLGYRSSSMQVTAEHGEGDEHEEEDEQEEMPEDLKDLPWKVQQMRLLLRSFSMMAAGTVLVLIFADPMVEVLSEMGERTGVPAFYISFVLSPLVSNASELIAAYNYASKKTSKTITISLATLCGACIMNNTFVLSVFLVLIYARGLAWEFSAETIAILFVELVIGVLALRTVHTVRTAFLIFSLYPVSLALVYILENVFGLN